MYDLMLWEKQPVTVEIMECLVAVDSNCDSHGQCCY